MISENNKIGFSPTTISAGEKDMAKAFGSHRSYHVASGSPASNRIVLTASVSRGQVALCDRNCLSSVEHAMTMSGAVPTYLVPPRNHYGLVGPIRPENLTPSAIKNAISANVLLKNRMSPMPVHAVITNSTCDGLCYNITRVKALLGKSVDRLHFDEAWSGYVRLNPIYRDRFAMCGDPAEHGKNEPTLFVTQSMHRLHAEPSPASMIHIRDGRNPIEHSRFNEAFMAHASISPLAPFIVSHDVSGAMMGDAIREAIAFRQTLAFLHTEFAAKKDWFFNVWQPDVVAMPGAKKSIPFYKAAEDLLAVGPSCWTLKPGDSWHGFGDIEDGYCMLDPIKVSVTTPGVLEKGGLAKTGIPASLLAAFLDRAGIVVEKTTDFTILYLFSVGVTKEKWGALLNALLEFKRAYDKNKPLVKIFPDMVEVKPEAYAGLGLKDLSDRMFQAMGELKTVQAMGEGFSVLPSPVCSPGEAFEELESGNVETLPLSQVAGRVVAEGIVPYPPGIPLLMPGESIGAGSLNYLKALEEYGRRFPGFSHEIRGVKVKNGRYEIVCLKEK